MLDSADRDPHASRSLWCAVLHNVVLDATGSVGGLSGESAKTAKSVARAWFRSGGKDFHIVCALAGVEPAPIREIILERIATLEAKGM